MVKSFSINILFESDRCFDNKEKDKIIRDQAGVLEEYRMEILRLRDERRDMNGGRISSSQQQYQHQSKKRPPPRKNYSNESQQVISLKYRG